ncbi:hypothetical protein RI138_18680 [Streptomyces sp. C11-1]|uniref:Uncharacterized protein n=1 Tax=Streptomyces durocortorensis TaxID=2811104 RepID=A0ABY9VXS4_9ACTN|nr:hypothetical protein [Streptomyces durocortorensis]WNF28691.1 hypothetical protein RI138_18680 [Streptomyces durocortorensis]
MYEVFLAARTSHSVNYGELAVGSLIAVIGSLLALNVRGCAEFAADFLGAKVFSAFYRNDLILRIPAGFFAMAGLGFSLINLKILFFGF